MRLEVNGETKKGVDQVRINVRVEDPWGTVNGLVILAKDGWHYDKYDTIVESERAKSGGVGSGDPTGKQVRISCNGPMRLTRLEWEELRDAIDAELDDL